MKKTVFIFIFLPLLAVGLWLWHTDNSVILQYSSQAVAFKQSHVILTFFLFTIGYVLATLVYSPRVLLTTIGGLLFGMKLGYVLSLLSSTVSAGIAFTLARTYGYEWVAKRFASDKYQRVQAEFEKRGWLYVALSRLAPVIPFTLLNYAFGLTNVSLRVFLIGSAIFMSPALLFYAYLGSLGT